MVQFYQTPFKLLQHPDVPKRYKQVVLPMMSTRGNNEHDLSSSENTCRNTIQTGKLASYLPQSYTVCSLKCNAVQQRLNEINSVFALHSFIGDSHTHRWMWTCHLTIISSLLSLSNKANICVLTPTACSSVVSLTTSFSVKQCLFPASQMWRFTAFPFPCMMVNWRVGQNKAPENVMLGNCDGHLTILFTKRLIKNMFFR